MTPLPRCHALQIALRAAASFVVGAVVAGTATAIGTAIYGQEVGTRLSG
jgi:hypothetical protein